MRKTVVAAAMAASLTVGGAAGAALFTPTLSGAQTDEPSEQVAERPHLTERLREELAPLVDDGTVTDPQADAVAEHLAEQAPFRPGRHGHGWGLGPRGEVAEALGLSTEELRDRLADGRTLAEIAEAEGVDVQAVVDAIVAGHQARLDEAVADGRLTQEEADERAAALEEHARDIVDGAFERRMGREGGMRGPGHGPSTGAGTTGS